MDDGDLEARLAAAGHRVQVEQRAVAELNRDSRLERLAAQAVRDHVKGLFTVRARTPGSPGV